MNKTQEDVRISQLGVFIDKAYKAFDLNSIKSNADIADYITKEFNVKCTANHIKQYHLMYEFNTPSEFESRAIEYGIKINY